MLCLACFVRDRCLEVSWLVPSWRLVSYDGRLMTLTHIHFQVIQRVQWKQILVVLTQFERRKCRGEMIYSNLNDPHKGSSVKCSALGHLIFSCKKSTEDIHDPRNNFSRLRWSDPEVLHFTLLTTLWHTKIAFIKLKKSYHKHNAHSIHLIAILVSMV